MAYIFEKIKIKHKGLKTILVTSSILMLGACATTEEFNSGFTNVTPQFATILNDNITIRSADNSWSMKAGGDPFRPEIVNTGGPLTLSRGKKFSVADFEKHSGNYYDVLLDIDGEKKPFYGRLRFNEVPSTANNTNTRAWRIRIPDSYIERAKGGVVSHVYGSVPFKGRLKNDYVDTGDWLVDISYPLREREMAGWILWFSDYPLE